MVVVIIAGVPKSLKYPKFLTFIKRGVPKGIDYDIKFKPKFMDDGTKEMSFYLKPNDARAIVRFIHGYKFRYANKNYPLQCWIKSSHIEEESIPNDFEELERRDVRLMDEYEPPRKSRRYSKSPMRSESGSPFYSNELREIEFKIELVRKQRILMEEETKLLLEKRKLECLKSVGTNDCANLVKFEEICKRYDSPECSKFADTPQKKPVASAKLPIFLGPCKEIIAQMQVLIKSNSDINSENRSLFWNLLRSTMKKRLAILVDGKGYISTRYIVSLYRAKYPFDTDTELVTELLSTISNSCWPKKNKNKNIETDANDDGQNNEPENPGAGTQEVKLDTTGENTSIDESQLVDLDEFIDLENDVENWIESKDADESSQAEDNVDLSKDEDQEIKPVIVGKTEENDAFGVENGGEKSTELNTGENLEKPKSVTVDNVDQTNPTVEEDADKAAEVSEEAELKKEA